MPSPTPSPQLTEYEQSVAQYWDNEANAVNLQLGAVDGLYHHHYGIGEVNTAVLAAPAEQREAAIIAELHRLETAQADLLLDHLGPLTATDRVLDAGSGRGGTSVMAHRRFGCHVDGVSISSKQVEFANQHAAELGVADAVRFHVRNMLDTGFDSGSFRAVWTNETDMYVDLDDLCAEIARTLAPGGRYITITGVINDLIGPRSDAVRAIDDHYGCRVHTRTNYLTALLSHGFTPAVLMDLTAATIPYWELRAQSTLATGIEEGFLAGYREHSFQYLLIASDRRAL